MQGGSPRWAPKPPTSLRAVLGRSATSRASTLGFATNCSTARPSSASKRLGSLSRVGGATTTRCDPHGSLRYQAPAPEVLVPGLAAWPTSAPDDQWGNGPPGYAVPSTSSLVPTMEPRPTLNQHSMWTTRSGQVKAGHLPVPDGPRLAVRLCSADGLFCEQTRTPFWPARVAPVSQNRPNADATKPHPNPQQTNDKYLTDGNKTAPLSSRRAQDETSPAEFRNQ